VFVDASPNIRPTPPYNLKQKFGGTATKVLFFFRDDGGKEVEKFQCNINSKEK